MYNGTFYSDILYIFGLWEFFFTFTPIFGLKERKKERNRHGADIYLSAYVSFHALENKAANLKERILECRTGDLC